MQWKSSPFIFHADAFNPSVSPFWSHPASNKNLLPSSIIIIIFIAEGGHTKGCVSSMTRAHIPSQQTASDRKQHGDALLSVMMCWWQPRNHSNVPCVMEIFRPSLYGQTVSHFDSIRGQQQQQYKGIGNPFPKKKNLTGGRIAHTHGWKRIASSRKRREGDLFYMRPAYISYSKTQYLHLVYSLYGMPLSYHGCTQLCWIHRIVSGTSIV